MNHPFDPFEFQLNLGSNSQANQKRLISVMITPKTNVEQVAHNICVQYSIKLTLVDVIAQTIYGEIENQIIQKQNKRSVSKKKSPYKSPQKSPSPIKNKNSSPSLNSKSSNNKTKKFKNRFCSYLKQSPAKPANKKSNPKPQLNESAVTLKKGDVETFRNSDHFINPSVNCPEEEYSFRPSCIETMDLNDNSFQNSLEITQPAGIGMSRCSFSSNFTTLNDKKTEQCEEKMISTKKQRTVFDNLYEHSIFLNIKKQIDRKKSFEKLTFKPELNQMSKKIIEKKMLNNPELAKSQKAVYLKSKVDTTSVMSKSRCEEKSLSKSKYATGKENKTPEKSVSTLKKAEKGLSIYERGVLFRKKSQDKLSRMKQRQFYDQIKSCSFTPTFFSRKSVTQSRIA